MTKEQEYKISLTEDDCYQWLIKYIRKVSGYCKESVCRAYVDNVPMPNEYPFAYISMRKSSSHATNEHDYTKPDDEKNVAGSKKISQSMILDVQVDFYGQDARNEALLVQTLFRDSFSTDFFNGSGLVPLYADDDVPESGSEDEKKNWKVRNTLTLHFNIHPAVVIPQDFFSEAEITTTRLASNTKISIKGDSNV